MPDPTPEDKAELSISPNEQYLIESAARRHCQSWTMDNCVEKQLVAPAAPNDPIKQDQGGNETEGPPFSGDLVSPQISQSYSPI